MFTLIAMVTSLSDGLKCYRRVVDGGGGENGSEGGPDDVLALVECPGDKVCMRIDTKVLHGDTKVATTQFDCIQREHCQNRDWQCELLKKRIKNRHNATLKKCVMQCCFEDGCNSPSTLGALQSRNRRKKAQEQQQRSDIPPSVDNTTTTTVVETTANHVTTTAPQLENATTEQPGAGAGVPACSGALMLIMLSFLLLLG